MFAVFMEDKAASKGKYSSLMPKKGWPMRNYHYLRHRVIPGIMKKPDGHTEAVAEANPICGGIKLTWTGHAGFLVQFESKAVVFDPNFAKWHGFVKRQRHSGLALHNVPAVDLVLVSHAHYDHMHKRALKKIEAEHGIVVPRGSAKLVKRLGFSKIAEMEVWEEVEFDDLKVIHTPSEHWGARFIHDTHRDYGGYGVSCNGKTVFHCGDSAYFDQFEKIGKQLGKIDVALMPIGAYGAPSGRDVHMNPEEALRSYLELGADRFVPMHYGTFPLGTEPMEEPLERLLAEADRLGVLSQVVVLEEGLSCVL